jgi:dipeptidase D
MNSSNVLEIFKDITRIPRESGHEERMFEFLCGFAEKRGLEYHVDEIGNVCIIKQASPGKENVPALVLQGHQDMVCEKRTGVEHDFLTDPINFVIEDGWMVAKDTTLGADDGIGVAAMLALLESDLPTGRLECVFTVSEETGMDGAFGMLPGFFTGKTLINLDSEDEGQIFVSCAGGITTEGHFRAEFEEAPADYFFLNIQLKGLVGGHSGDDINKKRANAIKLIARFLYAEMQKTDLRLASFNSGRMHNAIPRDGQVVIAVPNKDKEMLKADWNVFAADAADEFHVTDTAMEFLMESTDRQPVMGGQTAQNLIRALQAMHNGILSMCQDEEIAWLVETSSNVASVTTKENEVVVVASQRSNVMSNLRNMAATIKAVLELAGAEVVQGDGYPAWKMKANSELTRITVETYRKLFGKDPLVLGIHAGLECGLFSEKYPHMDMVSFGPTLRGVHSPDERLLIPTVQMVWDHLLEILKNIPEA